MTRSRPQRAEGREARRRTHSTSSCQPGAITPLAELKHRFWDPRWSYGVGPPLTAAALAVAEARLGHTLPAAYVELLAVQNGGSVRREFQVHRRSTAICRSSPGLARQMVGRSLTARG